MMPRRQNTALTADGIVAALLISLRTALEFGNSKGRRLEEYGISVVLANVGVFFVKYASQDTLSKGSRPLFHSVELAIEQVAGQKDRVIIYCGIGKDWATDEQLTESPTPFIYNLTSATFDKSLDPGACASGPKTYPHRD
jgi:hypothetical protein